MTQDQFNREKNYGATMAFVRTLLSKGIITEDDYQKIEAVFADKYRPVIGTVVAIKP